MTTPAFVEAQHPRAVTGEFVKAVNDAPAGQLTERSYVTLREDRATCAAGVGSMIVRLIAEHLSSVVRAAELVLPAVDVVRVITSDLASGSSGRGRRRSQAPWSARRSPSLRRSRFSSTLGAEAVARTMTFRSPLSDPVVASPTWAWPRSRARSSGSPVVHHALARSILTIDRFRQRRPWPCSETETGRNLRWARPE